MNGDLNGSGFSGQKRLTSWTAGYNLGAEHLRPEAEDGG